MSKHKGKPLREVFDVPEEQQHDPITIPEPPVLARAADAVSVQTEVKTMVTRAETRKVEYACPTDDQRVFAVPPSTPHACEPFCPICGYRMLRVS